MNTMIYNGYTASIIYSSADGCLVGCLIGIDDIVNFHGDSVAEVRQAFEEAVDDYLDLCAQADKEPQKPFSGSIALHVLPELHASLARTARTQGKTLNDFVAEILAQSIRDVPSTPISFTSPHTHSEK